MSRGTRSDVARLVEDTARMRSHLGGLLRTFHGRSGTLRGKLALGALGLVGLTGTVVGVRAVRGRKRRKLLPSPVRSRVRWALAAGLASLAARRFAKRALAP